MRQMIFIALVMALTVPALAIAGAPSPADKAASVKQCSSERGAMGATPFKLLYGTNANRSNAFGKCVSKLAQQNEQARSNAAAQCRSERTADETAFAAKYGIGKKHANAFGRCVSGKAKAAAENREDATKNAAKACWAERKAGVAAFNAKYATNASKSNAFGKCVSGKVKHS